MYFSFSHSNITATAIRFMMLNCWLLGGTVKLTYIDTQENIYNINAFLFKQLFYYITNKNYLGLLRPSVFFPRQPLAGKVRVWQGEGRIPRVWKPDFSLPGCPGKELQWHGEELAQFGSFFWGIRTFWQKFVHFGETRQARVRTFFNFFFLARFFLPTQFSVPTRLRV